MIALLQASVAFSGVTPSVAIMDALYFAGSAIYENDVTAAINHCEAVGYAEEDIIIDTILSSPAIFS